MVCANSASHRTSVELDPERVGDERHDLAEHRGSVACHVLQRGIVDRPREPYRQLGLGRVVARAVRRLEHRDRVDAVADARGEDGERVDEARIDAAAEHRAPTASARVFDRVSTVTERVTGDERRGRHDVDARFEDAHHLVDIGPLGVVHDAVGLERQQRVDVVGGEDAERLDPAELTDVAPDLVGAPGVTADELEVGVGYRGDDGTAADVAGGPLHDAERIAGRRIGSRAHGAGA